MGPAGNTAQGQKDRSPVGHGTMHACQGSLLPPSDYVHNDNPIPDAIYLIVTKYTLKRVVVFFPV